MHILVVLCWGFGESLNQKTLISFVVSCVCVCADEMRWRWHVFWENSSIFIHIFDVTDRAILACVNEESRVVTKNREYQRRTETTNNGPRTTVWSGLCFELCCSVLINIYSLFLVSASRNMYCALCVFMCPALCSLSAIVREFSTKSLAMSRRENDWLEAVRKMQR